MVRWTRVSPLLKSTADTMQAMSAKQLRTSRKRIGVNTVRVSDQFTLRM
jgi:hypothetical protein